MKHKQKAMLLGCGVRGTKWLKLLLEREDVELSAIVVPRLSRENELKQEFGLENVEWYRSLEDALENFKGDFCVVTTPPYLHYEQIKKLFNAGIDVMTEKPLVLNFEEAIDLTSLSKKNKRHLWIGQNFRYCQSSQYLYNTVKEKLLGKPEMSTILYLRNRDGYSPNLNKFPLTMEQPMLFEQSEHHFDLIRYCYDTEVGKVYGLTFNPSWSMYKNQATVTNIFEMKSGIIIDYFGTWSSSHGYFDFEWRTDFEKGVIIQKSLFGDIYTGEPNSEKLRKIELKPEEYFVDDTRILLNEFVLRKGKEIKKGTPDIFDNLKTIALIFATLKSDETKKAVYMDDFYKEIGIDKLLEGREF